MCRSIFQDFQCFHKITSHFGRKESEVGQCVVAYIIFLVFLIFSFYGGLEWGDLSYAICSEYFYFHLQFPFKLNQCINKLEKPIKDPCNISKPLQNDSLFITVSMQKKVATRWQSCKYDFFFSIDRSSSPELDDSLQLLTVKTCSCFSKLSLGWQMPAENLYASGKYTILLFKNSDLMCHEQLFKK